MIWLTWRQFRAQAITAIAGVAVFAIVYGVTGPRLAHLYAASGLAACHSGCAALTTNFLNAAAADPVYPALTVIGGALVYLAPVVMGAFWGAPLVARELEAGTNRLAWNQSVTRRRWLLAKLALVGLAVMATAGLLSLVLTWWSAPIDRAGGFRLTGGQLGRFSPILFGVRDIVPTGYAAFAFVLGVLAGILVRRTLAAMAITLACAALVLVAWPNLVRPHLIPPVTVTATVKANLETGELTREGEIIVPVTNLPGAWVISNQTITASGKVFVRPDIAACVTGTEQQCDAWFTTQHLRRRIAYQPASRYWEFQWYETAIFVALAVVLGGLCTLWIGRRIS